MDLKIHEKFEEKLIFCFKNKNLVKFDLSTHKSPNRATSICSYCIKYLMLDLKK